jgi:hypothetical protein
MPAERCARDASLLDLGRSLADSETPARRARGAPTPAWIEMSVKGESVV